MKESTTSLRSTNSFIVKEKEHPKMISAYSGRICGYAGSGYRGSRCNTDILPRNVLYDVRYASHFTFYTHDLVGGANESLPALPVCHSKEHQISLE